MAKPISAGRTGSHLKIEPLGDNVLGVKIHGNRNKPEPDSFRLEFPGGVIDLERCTDGSYWVHLMCNKREMVVARYGPDSGAVYSRFSEARMHMTTKHTSDANLGDFDNPGLYDVVLRIVRDGIVGQNGA